MLKKHSLMALIDSTVMRLWLKRSCTGECAHYSILANHSTCQADVRFMLTQAWTVGGRAGPLPGGGHGAGGDPAHAGAELRRQHHPRAHQAARQTRRARQCRRHVRHQRPHGYAVPCLWLRDRPIWYHYLVHSAWAPATAMPSPCWIHTSWLYRVLLTVVALLRTHWSL